MKRPVVLIVGAAAGAFLLAGVGASAHSGLSLARFIGVQSSTFGDEATGARTEPADTPEAIEKPEAPPTAEPVEPTEVDTDTDNETDEDNDVETNDDKAQPRRPPRPSKNLVITRQATTRATARNQATSNYPSSEKGRVCVRPFFMPGVLRAAPLHELKPKASLDAKVSCGDAVVEW